MKTAANKRMKSKTCHVCDGRKRGYFTGEAYEVACDTCEGTGKIPITPDINATKQSDTETKSVRAKS